jgi:hypothetical protein
MPASRGEIGKNYIKRIEQGKGYAKTWEDGDE